MMFQITGTIQNVFEAPGGKGKDGKEYPSQIKAQILGEVDLRNGEKKMELLTLNVPPSRLEEAKSTVGCEICWPCGLYVSGGKINAFLTD